MTLMNALMLTVPPNHAPITPLGPQFGLRASGPSSHKAPLSVLSPQDTVYFDNAAVTAEQTYAYDALDRLVEAHGREHTATFESSEGGSGVRRQKNVPYGRGPHAHPNDGTALRRYTQVYSYDAVGNLVKMKHHEGDLGTVLATRDYYYTNASGSTVQGASSDPFEPLFSNQLVKTKVGSTDYPLGYDEHGNMDEMPHLVDMSYSPFDRLHSIQCTAAWSSDGDTPTALSPTQNHDWFYVYDAGGRRARKVRAVGTSGAERSEERFYLGAFEVWREYDTNATETAAGVPETERETWHVSDDVGRIAMLETKTWSGGSEVTTPTPRWRLQLDDHLGTATGEVTEDGSIISYEEFHPYGTTAFQAVDGSIDVSRKRYRYTGMERDDETGLHYHHHRYYAPWLGRWTRPDPAGLVDGVNRWGYGRGTPASLVDTLGTENREARATDSEPKPSDSESAPEAADASLLEGIRNPVRRRAAQKASEAIDAEIDTAVESLRAAVKFFREVNTLGTDFVPESLLGELSSVADELESSDLIMVGLPPRKFAGRDTLAYSAADDAIEVPFNFRTGDINVSDKVLFHEAAHALRYPPIVAQDPGQAKEKVTDTARLTVRALEEIHAEFLGVLGSELIELAERYEAMGPQGLAQDLAQAGPTPFGSEGRKFLDRIGTATERSLVGHGRNVFSLSDDAHPALRSLRSALITEGGAEAWSQFAHKQFFPTLWDLARRN